VQVVLLALEVLVLVLLFRKKKKKKKKGGIYTFEISLCQLFFFLPFFLFDFE